MPAEITSEATPPRSIQPSRHELRFAKLCFGGFSLLFFLAWPFAHEGNDFLPFYTGAELASSAPRQLYSAGRAEAIQGALAPSVRAMPGSFLPVLRPPFYYALLSPLTALPFRWALGLWQLLSLASLIGFLALWPGSRVTGLIWAGLFVPLWHCFSEAQDFTLFLALLAGYAALDRAGRPFLAGAALSLCAGKPNVFLLVPLLALTSRSWKAVCGFCAAGIALYSLSSLMLGDWAWGLWYGPYLAALFPTERWGWLAFAAVLALLIAWWLWRVPADPHERTAVVLCASLAAAQSIALYDASALLPLCLVMGQRGRAWVAGLGVAACSVLWPVFRWPVPRPVVALVLADSMLRLSRWRNNQRQ